MRKSLSLAIPEAASTGVDLDFSHGESDITIGENEVLGQHEPGNGKETHLTAHLSPRSKLDVSWTSDADAGTRNSPLLTAKGEIAIDIDEEQVRTRSSWAVRCVRGTTRSLEMRIDDDDEVTELQLDEQSAEARIERVRGTGKLTIRLADPLRVGAVKRLVMKTRRSFVNAERSPDFVHRVPSRQRARTNGFHRHHAECELVRQAGDVARAAPGRDRQIAGRPAHSPLDELGLRVSRSAVLA